MQIFCQAITEIMWYCVLKVLIKLIENMQPSYQLLYVISELRGKVTEATNVIAATSYWNNQVLKKSLNTVSFISHFSFDLKIKFSKYFHSMASDSVGCEYYKI